MVGYDGYSGIACEPFRGHSASKRGFVSPNIYQLSVFFKRISRFFCVLPRFRRTKTESRRRVRRFHGEENGTGSPEPHPAPPRVVATPVCARTVRTIIGPIGPIGPIGKRVRKIFSYSSHSSHSSHSSCLTAYALPAVMIAFFEVRQTESLCFFLQTLFFS